MTVVERVSEALARLDEAAALGAVVARDDDASRRLATELDAHGSHGSALFGQPLTVKDWIDVVGLPCEGESPTRTHRRPDRDATAVARMKAAGAVVIAKTQPGADHPLHGRCHHPLDPNRTPGGSSSGEAALLGAGASSLGLGSDSGGSIRLPAAWCGVAGLKPTFGLVPTTGHFPRVGPRYDGRTVIGPLARRVARLGAALAVIAGPDGVDSGCVPVPLGDPAAVAISTLRVGVVRGEGAWQAAGSTADAVERAVGLLASSGATVVDDALPAHLDEVLHVTRRYWGRRALTGLQVDEHLAQWDRVVGRLTRAARSFDVIIGPVVADVAPIARPVAPPTDGTEYVFTLPWSLAGWPALSVPMGQDPATGLPLAVQVAAPAWHDHVVLAVGAILDR